MKPRHRLLVCGSCSADRGRRRGHDLLEALEGVRLRDTVVEEVECLSACSRPCAIALAAPGKWTWIFGDLGPGDAQAVVETVALYASTTSGFLERELRPPALRARCIGRVPPAEE